MMLVLILSGVLLNSTAQLLLKTGMLQIGHFEFSISNAIPIALKVIVNLPIIAGLTCYVLSVGFWLLVLSRIPVSVAYPMLSIGYIVNALAAHFLFAEPLTSVKVLGIFVIITGVYIVAQN